VAPAPGTGRVCWSWGSSPTAAASSSGRPAATVAARAWRTSWATRGARSLASPATRPTRPHAPPPQTTRPWPEESASRASGGRPRELLTSTLRSRLVGQRAVDPPIPHHWTLAGGLPDRSAKSLPSSVADVGVRQAEPPSSGTNIRIDKIDNTGTNVLNQQAPGLSSALRMYAHNAAPIAVTGACHHGWPPPARSKLDPTGRLWHGRYPLAPSLQAVSFEADRAAQARVRFHAAT
jgi:hypothetical protein